MNAWGQSPHSLNEWALASDESARRSIERRRSRARRRRITTYLMMAAFVLVASALLTWVIPALI